MAAVGDDELDTRVREFELLVGELRARVWTLETVLARVIEDERMKAIVGEHRTGGDC